MYFNSQPLEEADLAHAVTQQPHAYFNSQPHEEADIHSWLSSSQYRYFNSQPHEEADDYLLPTVSKADLFQLTASRGGWPIPFW